MAKKNNPKAEKAKRNLEYARLHKKKSRPFGRGGRPSGPRFGDRPAPAERPAGEPVARSSEAAPASAAAPVPATAPSA